MKQYTLQETTTEGLKPLANRSIFNTNRLSGRIREIIPIYKYHNVKAFLIAGPWNNE